MPFSAVLFDLDGTLIDTWRLYIEAYRRTFEPFFGRVLTDSELAALKPTSERATIRRVVGESLLETYHSGFINHYHTLHERLCEGVYPGVPEMLERLRRSGYCLGLVTGKSTDAWKITSLALGLGEFDVVVTENDVEREKPDPAGLRLALERLGVSSREALYIGDSHVDREAAAAANVQFGAALWAKTADEAERFAAEAAKIGGLIVPTPAALVEQLVRD